MNYRQIMELPKKDRLNFGAWVNYTLSKEYFAQKRRKQIMKAIKEQENNYDSTSITESR